MPHFDHEREIHKRGRRVLRTRTNQLMRVIGYIELFDTEGDHPGPVAGLLWAWLVDAQRLVRRLAALQEQVMDEEKLAEIAGGEAVDCIHEAVRALRPHARFMPIPGWGNAGPAAVLGMGLQTAQCLLVELASLLEGSGPPGA